MKYILIVGYGNICRSPIAERLLANKFPDKTVWSAGLNAVARRRAMPMSQEVARAHGVNLGTHLSEPVTWERCDLAQLILVMDHGLAGDLERQFPPARGKVFRLGEIGAFDVIDPYCQTRAMFQMAFDQIQHGVADWIPSIRRGSLALTVKPAIRLC